MSIRISSNQVINAGVDSMNTALNDATAWQQKISSGKNYTKASDNVYAISRGVELDFDISRLQMFKSNQAIATNNHNDAQSQMDSILNQLTQLKTTFIQSQNASLNQSNFAALAIQAEQIRDAIQSQMTATDSTGHAIFPDDTNSVQIEPGVTVASGVAFNDAFGANGSLAGSEDADIYLNIDAFVTYLTQKSQGLTTTKTGAQVSSGLDTSYTQLMQAQQTSGGISKQVDNAQATVVAVRTELIAASSALLDTDMAEATAAFTRSQTLLNAAQAMFARLQQSNLFSKL
ncbi:Flagellin-related hook-associated protein [Polynucleobacter duraquae]|jgi:flagellar hook-associated protein 3 FlgL|uniref:Flagellin n=1 Tax=Polynucleobacter duraquae TaxID=1835254 RepID=A0A0E3V0P4_9BURK|nr:flagellin [Polynucleobacter duraquae]AKD24798.1 Flagellin-related hook-associated protein [Polynucleobacter duraquae]